MESANVPRPQADAPDRPRGRRVALTAAGLLLAVAVVAWFWWPSEQDRARALVAALGGSTISERDEFGRPTESVILVRRPIADADVATFQRLAVFPGLRLFLDGTAITDQGLANLRDIPGLHKLSLCATQVTDRGLKELAALPHLEELSLKYCAVTDRGLDALKGLPGLRSVNVQQTRVTSHGAEDFRRARRGVRVWHALPDD